MLLVRPACPMWLYAFSDVGICAYVYSRFSCITIFKNIYTYNAEVLHIVIYTVLNIGKIKIKV